MTLESRILTRKVRTVLEKDAMSVIAIMNKISSPRKIARRIISDVKKELGYEPKLASVAKIVERFVDEVEKSGKLHGYDMEDIKNVVSKMHLILHSDIAVIGMRMVRDVDNKLNRIIQIVYSGKEIPFLNITLENPT